MVRSLARGWQDRPTTANDNGLELRIAGRFGFGARAVNTAKLPDLAESHSSDGGLLSRARRGEVDPPVRFSKTGE